MASATGAASAFRIPSLCQRIACALNDSRELSEDKGSLPGHYLYLLLGVAIGTRLATEACSLGFFIPTRNPHSLVTTVPDVKTPEVSAYICEAPP